MKKLIMVLFVLSLTTMAFSVSAEQGMGPSLAGPSCEGILSGSPISLGVDVDGLPITTGSSSSSL